jgi:hypothetical protein
VAAASSARRKLLPLGRSCGGSMQRKILLSIGILSYFLINCKGLYSLTESIKQTEHIITPTILISNIITNTFSKLVTKTQTQTFTKANTFTDLPPTQTKTFTITPTINNRKISTEDYEIYSLALKAQYNGYVRGDPIIIDINTSTITNNSLLNPELITALLGSVQKDTIDDFMAINKHSYKLSRYFNIGKNYLLDEEDLSIEKLREKYPHAYGIVSISRIGFNNDRTEAIIDLGIFCGGMCGVCKIVQIIKDNNIWRIVANEPYCFA